MCRQSMTANVLQLGEVAETEAQMFSFAQKFNRITAVEFSTEPRHFAKLLLCAVILHFLFRILSVVLVVLT